MTLESLLAAKAVIIFGWFACFFVAERVIAAAAAPKSNSRLWRNGGLWLFVLLLSPLVVAPIAALGANNVLWERPQWVGTGFPGFLVLLIDIILLDLWVYGLHQAYHRVPFMWRLHEVHHRDEFLDSTSAVRFHIGEVVLSAALRLIPISLLAVPLSTIILFEIILLCAAIFHHSNLRMPTKLERAISYVFVTPSIHWVHHHAVQSDTDSNYATIFSVWDRLFSTKSSFKRKMDMKIGVEGVEDQSFLRLILMPLLRNG